MTLIVSARSTSCSEARMVTVRSLATVTSTSLGKAACRSGNSAFTSSTLSMMLASAWR